MLPSSSLIAIFIFSFVAGMGAVVSPGPVSTAIVSQSPRRGWQVGPLVATGHSLLELALVILIVLGLGSVLAHTRVQTAIGLLGGALLAWMGGMMMWDTWKGKVRLPDREAQVEPLTGRQMVGLGMLATVSNPFWYAWWVTVAAGYLGQARAFSVAAVSAFYLGHISADYTWDTMLSALVGGGSRWMTNRLYRLLMLACGIFFVYLGYVFVTQGIASLR